MLVYSVLDKFYNVSICLSKGNQTLLLDLNYIYKKWKKFCDITLYREINVELDILACMFQQAVFIFFQIIYSVGDHFVV